MLSVHDWPPCLPGRDANPARVCQRGEAGRARVPSWGGAASCSMRWACLV